jgi:serine/threonine protein kinase
MLSASVFDQEKMDFDEAKKVYAPLLINYTLPYDDYSEFKHIIRLSEGSYGKVYSAEFNGEKIALKTYCRNIDSIIKFFPEAFTMSLFKSPHVVALKNILYPDSTETLPPIITMKLYKDTLYDFLKKTSKDSISLKQRYQWCMQLCYGLNEIHKKKYLHRDLRSKNVFFDDKDNAVIGDLSEACPQSSAIIKRNENRYYFPPEVSKEIAEKEIAQCTVHSDIYGLGILFLEIARHKTIDEKKNFYHFDPNEVLNDCPLIFKKLIEKCCHNIPTKRPSAEELAREFKAALEELQEKKDLPLETLAFEFKKDLSFDEVKNIYGPLLTNYRIPYEEAYSFKNNTLLTQNVTSSIYTAEFNEEKIAYKIYKGSTDWVRFFLEAFIMSHINSPNVIGLKKIIYPDMEDLVAPIMIMKLYKDSLYNLLEKTQKDSISLEQQYKWCLQLCEGLNAIHELKCLHLDLASKNIFLDGDNNLVIGDLGEASSESNAILAPNHDPFYCAPEIVEKLVDEKAAKGTIYSDIYGLGLIFLEIATQNVLNHINVTFFKFLPENIPKNCPLLLKKLIEKCCDNTPTNRPSAKELSFEFKTALQQLQEKPDMESKTIEQDITPPTLDKKNIRSSEFQAKNINRLFNQNESNKKEQPVRPTPTCSCLIL